jgi:ubiquinone/menaquinone biosynthesis C-methylase UbiE
MKDYFSSNAKKYFQYRPSYPKELFDFIYSHVSQKQNAWDCGTGNGQAAFELSKVFENVYATDISENQLQQAIKAKNIFYSLQPAEKTHFENHFFDLITVAQAVHWFNFEAFYNEVKRTAKENAVICLFGYGLLRITPEIDNIIDNFYYNIVYDYWDKERRYIEEEYKTIPFPFEEISCPKFINQQQWDIEHLLGYLSTWSSVKTFIQKNGYNPINAIKDDLYKIWDKNQKMTIHFSIFMRMGRIR